MKIRWSKNKNLKPSVILGRIDSIKTLNPDGSVSYSGFEYHELFSALRSMIEATGLDDEFELDATLSRAVSNIAKSGPLNADQLIAELNTVIKSEIAKREDKYHVLTSISLGEKHRRKTISIEGCSIRFLSGNYPKKYADRDKAVGLRIFASGATPSGYTKVVISLKAKSESSAAKKALRALDIQRAIWSLFSNPGMVFSFGSEEWAPINKIRLGKLHTVHSKNGKVFIDRYWYEPNFVEAKLFSHGRFSTFEKNSRIFLDWLQKLPYREDMKEVLLRYVRALDERDQNVALLKLWGALERLTSSSESNYDSVVRRTVFLFRDREYHEQILEHLRDYRNRSVHAGDQDERARTGCYQLQYYLFHLISFHLRNAGQFLTLADANAFLDLPPKLETLQHRKALIEKAIKFVSSET